MTELESLTAFITANLPPRAMQMFLPTMENGEIIRSAKGLGLGQKRIGVLRYDAVLSWDNFPYRECSPGLVYALVLTWLSEHANALNDELKLPDPTVDPEYDDDGSCILQVVVAVADEIILKPSDTGAVPSKGQRWDVVYPEVWTAEEAEYFTQHGSAL
ncbi:phage tail protein [Serratia liquefaciens]|uniref:Phage tail protein n=1 Tax=Serratia liquefaciens TaxID=614 RepID=A0A515CRS5_SERLI|nr:phage tail protein [Serratia liquefaciens]QDL30875.1 phage tail protein [Serratia liquefaciens]